MDIKLFVCCHEPTEVPKHPLLVPLQVGAALAEEHYSGFLHDDTGDNISYKNRFYCELTGQYWVWKNVKADYYGFFHYRRYLYPGLSAKRPYRIEMGPTLELLEKLHFPDLESLVPQYDLILPKGENMYIPVQEHYADAPFHHRKDLELIKEVLRERHPKYENAMDAYLSGTICYFGNIFIMKRELFHDYCAWLFPILEEFDHRTDTSSYSAQERRVDGYLAERLLGVYAAFWRTNGEIPWKEIPCVHFYSGNECIGRFLLNQVLPPGSRLRAWAKRMRGGYRERERRKSQRDCSDL